MKQIIPMVENHGDTRRNLGQRAVAEKFAQIALLGAAAIVSLLAVA